jgi:RNA recognition motif-containing protein
MDSGSESEPIETLYVKNINDKINPKVIKHNLYLLFSTYGDIVQIITHKGQAHIVFTNETMASLAKRALQNEPFFDKPLVIEFAKSRSKLLYPDQ